MKKAQLSIHPLLVAWTIALALGTSACRVAGGIFKAGVWIGVVVAIALLAIIAAVVRLAGGRA